ncbi:lipopolysaccharide transport periplasmic protein LptA [Acinetobacter rathckeae]|uniref:lipopolysaccharide transport periplasmic protein LptA n=1 Tax=Acinetobacter rathckeae TaxID=2605272 RepID=UPI0018A25BA4|nr:lipopolysaccharide transport periplasmic protein LptA [Acinetobacter rathckeae]MBF7687129.1 lipopolysaccharide transport periplasmic protein LptA [Acinetobacter rathckeae]MBF7694519.1 lipopolysaccharide transport periplasmic protein LptA [Acinetobacter rathckeae]
MHLNTPLFQRKISLNIALLSALLVQPLTAFALPSDRSQPISLVADKATYNDKTGITTYTGNVVIEQGSMKLQANAVTAQLNKARQISTVSALGSPARFQQQTDANKLAKGQAQKIVYSADTGIITLTGNALVDQDGASIRGATLRYSMNKGDIEAVGDRTGGAAVTTTNASQNQGRVQITIPANSSKAMPGAVSQ